MFTMPKLPNPTDATLAAADAAMVAGQDRYKRKYLGMSAIGDPCERKLWFSFRHALTSSFDAPTLKRFEDGHRTEDLIIARLRKVECLEIVDRDGKGQIACVDLGGHFRGHLDYMARGLIQAPKAWHVGEVKCTAKLSDLEKAKADLGEKNSLAKWDETYWGQAQCYMHYQGVDRHWLVATSPGGREWTSVRTEYDPVGAMRLIGKAERIIFSDNAPPRIADSDTFYLCRWCDYSDICHGTALPERACRNCIHSTPVRGGDDAKWTCNVAAFGQVCPQHRFLPSMINGRQTDVRGDAIVYEMKDGGEYVDTGR